MHTCMCRCVCISYMMVMTALAQQSLACRQRPGWALHPSPQLPAAVADTPEQPQLQSQALLGLPAHPEASGQPQRAEREPARVCSQTLEPSLTQHPDLAPVPERAPESGPAPSQPCGAPLQAPQLEALRQAHSCMGSLRTMPEPEHHTCKLGCLHVPPHTRRQRLRLISCRLLPPARCADGCDVCSVVPDLAMGASAPGGSLDELQQQQQPGQGWAGPGLATCATFSSTLGGSLDERVTSADGPDVAAILAIADPAFLEQVGRGTCWCRTLGLHTGQVAAQRCPQSTQFQGQCTHVLTQTRLAGRCGCGA